MKIIRKINHYLKYLIGLILQSPKLVIKEFLEDYRKDKRSINIKKDHNLIWVCSLPKSGSTLVEEILSFYPYVKLDRSLNRFYSKGLLTKPHDISHEMFQSAPKKSLSFIKTHTFYDEKFIEIAKRFNTKVILTFRDIRDVMISRYFHIIADKKHRHHKILNNMDQKSGFIASFEKNGINKKISSIDYYYNWVLKWRKNTNSKNFLELWFEEYVTDPENYFKKILKFIGENEKDSQIKSLKDYMNKNKRRKMKKSFSELINDKSKNVSTFRSGKINNWKNFFDEEITEKFNNSLPGPLNLVLKK